MRDVVSINRQTLRQKIICQCDIKHIIMLQIKTIASVLKVSTNIITNITAGPIRLGVILEIMSVSIFINANILYISPSKHL